VGVEVYADVAAAAELARDVAESASHVQHRAVLPARDVVL
jgi:hypothetical protein